MKFRWGKQKELIWRLCFNSLLAAFFMLCGYCAPMAYIVFFALIPILLYIAPAWSLGIFVMVSIVYIIFPDLISVPAWIVFAGVYLAILLPEEASLVAQQIARQMVPLFFAGFLMFLITCLFSAALRFWILRRRIAEPKIRRTSFATILLLYCGMEVFVFPAGCRFYGIEPDFPFLSLANIELFSLALIEVTIWIFLFCFRLWLLWHTHRTILEYDRLLPKGRVIN